MRCSSSMASSDRPARAHASIALLKQIAFGDTVASRRGPSASESWSMQYAVNTPSRSVVGGLSFTIAVSSIARLSSHWAAFAHALSAAPYEKSSGARPRARMTLRSRSDSIQSPLFPHALIAMLYMIWVAPVSCSAQRSSATTCSQRPARFIFPINEPMSRCVSLGYSSRSNDASRSGEGGVRLRSSSWRVLVCRVATAMRTTVCRWSWSAAGLAGKREDIAAGLVGTAL